MQQVTGSFGGAAAPRSPAALVPTSIEMKSASHAVAKSRALGSRKFDSLFALP